jgi:hypothetical protein
MFVTPLKSIKYSTQLFNILVSTVRCKLINLIFQIFHLFVPEMPADLTCDTVQIIPIDFAWIL